MGQTSLQRAELPVNLNASTSHKYNINIVLSDTTSNITEVLPLILREQRLDQPQVVGTEESIFSLTAGEFLDPQVCFNVSALPEARRAASFRYFYITCRNRRARASAARYSLRKTIHSYYCLLFIML